MSLPCDAPPRPLSSNSTVAPDYRTPTENLYSSGFSHKKDRRVNPSPAVFLFVKVNLFRQVGGPALHKLAPAIEHIGALIGAFNTRYNVSKCHLGKLPRLVHIGAP